MIPRHSAFVLMPFRQPYDSYYPAIFRPALEAAGFAVERADDLYTPRPVMLDIQDRILKCDLVLCEMTGRNPNVFYELGLAHAAGKPAILISTTEEDIPFDLRHVRVLHYDPRMAGWEEKLRLAIEKSAIAAISSSNVWPPPLASLAAPDGRPDRTLHRRQRPREPHTVARPINLGFDGAVENGYPHGWFNSVGYVSRVSDDYAVRVVDREDLQTGRCLMIYKSDANPREFGSVMQRFPADFLADQSVRLQGELRTEDVEGWAGLWLRADGEEASNLFFDNMSGHRVQGTTPWTSYAVEASLPPETKWLNIGVVFSGKGIVWADNVRLFAWANEAEWVDV